MPDRPDHLRRALIQQLNSLHAAGVRELPRVDTAVEEFAEHESPVLAQSNKHSNAEQRDMAKTERSSPSAGPEVGNATVTANDQPGQLEVLQQEVAACKLCSELASTRTQTVFGVGNPDARVVFFGEAPGADEDRQGEPFVGRAGQLLTKIISACTWSREDVYILNTLKCRPPSNRNPELDELHNCRPFWQRQLEIIQPEYIVCLGKFAMQELLNTKPTQSIGKMRKAFHNLGEIKVVVTYHPSYLLRNPAAKKDVWDDMKMLMADMGIKVP